MENGTAGIGVCVLAFFLSPRGCCMYPFLTLNLQIASHLMLYTVLIRHFRLIHRKLPELT